MADNKIVGYKKIFGFVLPDWVDEASIRLMVTFLMTSAAMLFVLIFIIWPKFEIVNNLKSSLVNKQTQLDALKGSKAGFDKLNDQIPESTQSLIMQAIPQTYSPEGAIFMLRSIANNTPGVSILSYSLPSGLLFETDKVVLEKSKVDKNESMVNFISFPIKLSVSARVDTLLSFINKIESSLPFGVVSDLNMQEVSKLANSNTEDDAITIELEIKYFQAVLKKVDISKITPFTSDDLSLVQILSGYSQINPTGGVSEVPVANNTTGNLFNF